MLFAKKCFPFRVEQVVDDLYEDNDEDESTRKYDQKAVDVKGFAEEHVSAQTGHAFGQCYHTESREDKHVTRRQ